jgi:hypothetical protein
MQLKYAREFIERKTKFASEKDLIIMVGDMNTNG